MRRVCVGTVVRTLLLVFVAGCTDSAGTAPEPPRVASIIVSPGSATLTFLGETAAFTASVTDQYGAAFHGTVSWSSSDPGVFTVNSTGGVQSVSNGSGTVSAELNGVGGNATVTVNQRAAAMERVSGDGQRGLPGVPLHAPVVTRVLDAGGTPVVGAGVAFSATEGNGSVSPGTALTDAHGQAHTVWTLGDALGRQSLTASVADGASAIFTATAQQPNHLADSVAVVSGDGQATKPGKGLRNPIVVRVLDERANPIAGVTVLFGTAAGHGRADPDSVHTDSGGEAATTWTLGDKVGPQLLAASVPGGPKARIVAMGSFGVCDRTPQVRDALVVKAGVSSCDEVTDDLLLEIRELNLRRGGIVALDRRDFAGLSALRSLYLSDNRLTDLPSEIFAPLSNLETLELNRTGVTLRPHQFSGLSSLHDLYRAPWKGALSWWVRTPPSNCRSGW